jgi:heterodisulfide reductase subunit A
VGRIPSEFFLKAVSLGIERVAVIPCADGHCRFEDGNRNIRNRILLLQPLLQALHYDPGLVTAHQVMGPVASVSAQLCSGCGTCMSICRYGAISMNGFDGVALFAAHVEEGRCQGCGACVASCPSRAINLSRFADAQVLAQIQAALGGRPLNGSRVLGFRCNWCSYGDADLPFDRLNLGSGIDVIRVPCVGRIDPLHLVWAFLNGADGVFLGGCHPDNCRYERGSARTEERLATLKTLLDAHGFDSRRLVLEWIPRDTVDRFPDALRSFARQIQKLGAVRAGGHEGPASGLPVGATL